MTHPRALSYRPALASMYAVIMIALLIPIAVILGSFAMAEATAGNQAIADAQAYQMLLAARAWSRLNSDRLAPGDAIELPLESLAPAATERNLELQRIADDSGRPLIACRLKLRIGTCSVYEQVCWPGEEAAPGTGPRQ